MDPMNGGPEFWNGHRWVQRRVTNSDIHFPVLWSNFTMDQLCGMSCAVLAGPQGQRPLPISSLRLNDAFYNALDTETTSIWPEPRWPEEIESTLRPVGLPRQVDNGVNLIDASMAGQQVREFNDALVIDSSTTSTSSSPERNKRKYEEVECDVAPRQVKFPRHEQRNENFGSGNGFLANWSSQTPLATGVWHNGAHNIAPHHEIAPGPCISHQDERELAWSAAVAEPGGQTPGVAVNSVALRHPHLTLQSDNHGATASGSHVQKILNETSQVARYQCDECTQSRGRPITFKLKKDLQRHLTRTVTHNAPPVARCSTCGKTVTRIDAMPMHHKYCQGSTLLLNDAEAGGAGQGPTGQGM